MVKARLASFDRAGLLGLVQDLYAAHPDNRTFLHTRFGLGQDVLEPYKQTIDQWLWPDAFRKQDTSVVEAKQPISNYKKAVGDPKYVDVTVQRWQSLAGKKATLDGDARAFDEIASERARSPHESLAPWLGALTWR